MTRLLVEYLVPVLAVVEMDADGSGTISQMVVIDEALPDVESTTVYAADGHTVVDPRTAELARQVADQADVPAWQFGW